ncbi:hypothetical protein GGD67_005395 [Bradyrhizobium sp. IAR9]|nr:hypothetical protein [Bradyrhizobium sp. IAR9]
MALLDGNKIGRVRNDAAAPCGRASNKPFFISR